MKATDVVAVDCFLKPQDLIADLLQFVSRNGGEIHETSNKEIKFSAEDF